VRSGGNEGSVAVGHAAVEVVERFAVGEVPFVNEGTRLVVNDSGWYQYIFSDEKGNLRARILPYRTIEMAMIAKCCNMMLALLITQWTVA